MSGAFIDLARTHAALLSIMTPMLGALLAAIAPSVRLSWVIGVIAAIAMATFAGDLAVRALLADWPAQAGEGIALAPDGIGVFAAALVAASAALMQIASGGVAVAGSPRSAPFATALTLFAIAGWIGALFAQTLTGMLAGAAIAWFAAVAVAGLSGERDRAALNGALRMLATGGVAVALIVFGVALIARGVGSLDLAALERARISAPLMAQIGAALVCVGLAMKAGAAPLHAWVGAAFGRADARAAMLLGIVGSVGALAVLMRFATHAIAAPALGQGLATALAALGMVGVGIGSLQAAGAHTLPRLAAYAAAAQAGCILVSVALGSPAGIAAALVQITALAATMLALLTAAAAAGVRDLNALDGLARRAPLASVALTAGALGLMGAPLTLGFLGRWRLIEAAVGVGWWWAACAAIAASLAGVFYGGRLVERVYFRRASATNVDAPLRWRFEFAPALLAAILLTAIGLEPSVLLRAANAAAAAMYGAP